MDLRRQLNTIYTFVTQNMDEGQLRKFDIQLNETQAEQQARAQSELMAQFGAPAGVNTQL